MLAPDVYAASAENGPLRQGEILSGVVQFQLDVTGLKVIPSKGEAAPLSGIEHPLLIIVSQDCDLDWDHKARCEGKLGNKELPNVFFCEVVDARQLPVPEPGFWKKIKTNKEERYHFLQQVPRECDALKEGLPEMAMDFKRCFSIPTPEIYFQLLGNDKRRCRLVSPYLEHFSQRVGHFHSRVGLQAEHFSEPSQK